MTTLTKFGFREWGGAGILSLLLLTGSYWLFQQNYRFPAILIAAAALLFFAAVAFFFRSPTRRAPRGSSFWVSPGDGVVQDIELVENFNFPPFSGKARRVGILLSVFNVPLTYSTANLAVESLHYREGEHFSARREECKDRNEAITLVGRTTGGEKVFPLAIRQISGKIACRIICPVQPGRRLRKGEVFGMVKFGSRTELYLPTDGVSVKVTVGAHVRGGETIIAEINE